MRIGTSVLAVLMGLVLAACSTRAVPTLSTEDIEALAAEGFVYGFAPVILEETRLRTDGPRRQCGPNATLNGFDHALEPANPLFRTVVKPNVDTLYSAAFIDLSAGPMALDMPGVSERYVLMAMYDAYTNNFAGPGTETHGDEAARYILLGPGQSTDVEGTVIEAPTNVVWIIGRTEFFGPDDIPAVNAIQEQFALVPLKGALEGKSEECLEEPVAQTTNDMLMTMPALEYFTILHEVMVHNPPPEADHDIAERLAAIGIGPKADVSLADLSADQVEALERGVSLARQRLLDGLRQDGPVAPWTPTEAFAVGTYGTDYAMRTIVALVGLGANRPEYSVYRSSSLDAQGHPYNGSKTYRLTFDAGSEPAVRAFWSLTVYDEEGFLIPNAIDRYALGSNTGLTRDADGAVSIILSSTAPEGVPLSNWLPIPEGGFTLTLRLYGPEAEALVPGWVPPAVEPIE